MLEIRSADLRFTLEESREFLRQSLGFDLPAEHLLCLEECTEGWAAGLQLASLAMQGLPGGSDSSRLDAFIEQFSGDDRYVLDYLVEEVLSQLPEEARGCWPGSAWA